jgi:hypothetical protein
MPRDSQATFTSATKAKIRNKYNNRCAICCCKLPKGSSECAHLFDRAGTGAKQVSRVQRSLLVHSTLKCVVCRLRSLFMWVLYRQVISGLVQRMAWSVSQDAFSVVRTRPLTSSECPNCHELFTREHVALSPSPQILSYIVDYLRETDAADRKPLHEVWFSSNQLLTQSQGFDMYRFFVC